MNLYSKNLCFFLAVSMIVTLTGMRPPGPPEALITNGMLQVRLFLPDAGNGYYRGTRFDWAGVIPSVKFNGHEYFGQWFDNYHPATHDAIMGPVEEFAPLGYEEANTGESFVKIGVGRLTKPGDRQYTFHANYAVADAGNWKIKTKADKVEFTHTLPHNDYGYEYTKTVSVTKGKPEMVLTHKLKNKGKLRMQTTVYNHNFFLIDKEPTGPNYRVTFPINNLSATGGKGVGDILKLQGNQIRYLRTLNKGEQGYFPDLAGGDNMPYDIKVDNIKTGAGVQIKGDRAISRMAYWSSPTTVCPEPYIKINLEPGKTFTWKIAYHFYTTAAKN